MSNPGRLGAAIVLGAVAVFAVLWWRASPAPPVAPSEAPPAETPRELLPVPAAAAPPAPAAPAADPVEPLVDPDAAARSQLAHDFTGIRIAPDLLARLADALVAETVQRLWATSGADAARALERVRRLCVVHGIRPRESAAARVDPLLANLAAEARPVRTRIHASVRGEDAWRERFAADCERSGIGSPEQRERLRERLADCADAGNGDCIVLAMKEQQLTRAQSLARLQSAAVLGSRDAMGQLVAMLEHGGDTSPAAQQAARYWRERLREVDADYRMAQLLCAGPDCRRTDPDDAMRLMLGAVREGSAAALAMLGTPASAATAYASAPGLAGDVPVANVSDVDAYAWAAVAERLTTAGCFGFWPNWAHFVGRAAEIGRALSPAQLVEAERAAAGRWDAYGPTLAAKWSCAVTPDSARR